MLRRRSRKFSSNHESNIPSYVLLMYVCLMSWTKCTTSVHTIVYRIVYRFRYLYVETEASKSNLYNFCFVIVGKFYKIVYFLMKL